MAPAVMIGAMVVGSALSAYGSIREGESEREQGRFLAGQSRNKANQSDTNANLTLDAAQKDERRKRQENASVLGSIRAAFGANGVGLDGSAQDYFDYQASIAAENEMDIRHEGVLRAMGYRDEAKSLREQAIQYEKTGANAYTSGLIKAGGAIVSGIGSIAKQAYDGRATTAPKEDITSGVKPKYNGVDAPKLNRTKYYA